jgi:hypothetical protein
VSRFAALSLRSAVHESPDPEPGRQDGIEISETPAMLVWHANGALSAVFACFGPMLRGIDHPKTSSAVKMVHEVLK